MSKFSQTVQAATMRPQESTTGQTGKSLLNQLLDKPVDLGRIEYTPFGEQRKIVLSVSIVKRLLCKPTRSGRLCSNEDALRFIAQCQARALNPFLGDAYLVGYDNQKTGQPEFSIITSANVFYKRAESSLDFDGMESGVICLGESGEIKDFAGDFFPPGWKPIGGWAIVTKKNRSKPTVSRLRIEAYQKQNEFWTKDPGGMITKCAEVDALRRAFPNNSPGLGLEVAVSATDLGASIAASPESERQHIAEPTEPATAAPQLPQDAPADDDGDLGPAEKPEPAEPDYGAPCIGPKQAQLQQWMTDAQVSFDDFCSYLKSSGILKSADSMPSWAEVSDKICDLCMKGNGKVALKIHRIYGKKEGA
jgi:phage recombination protein Bet